MTLWINHAAVTFTSNTSGVTADPNGTAVVGTPFVPTAGRFLVAVVAGAVTSTTPSGWTLPGSGSAVNNTGLYVFFKTAAGGDTLTTINNGTGWAASVDFYEFAAGTTLVASANIIGTANGTAGPTLTGLSGSVLAFEAASIGTGQAFGSGTWTFTGATVSASVINNYNGNSGDFYGLAYVDNVTTPTWSSPVATSDIATANSQERVAFALNVASGASTVTDTPTLTTASSLGATANNSALATSTLTSASSATIAGTVTSSGPSATLTSASAITVAGSNNARAAATLTSGARLTAGKAIAGWILNAISMN